MLEYPHLHDSDKICIFWGCVCKFCFDFRSCETYWVRLNYATTHHDQPRPTTIHHHHHIIQIIFTTTHHHPKYVHHHPPPAKIYLPLPTTFHKMDHHPAKAKIYLYIISFRCCFNILIVLGLGGNQTIAPEENCSLG